MYISMITGVCSINIQWNTFPILMAQKISQLTIVNCYVSLIQTFLSLSEIFVNCYIEKTTTTEGWN